MSTPDESVPQEPTVVPDEAAAQDAAAAAEAAAAAQLNAIRELATEIAKQAVLDFDPATIRKGAVTAIADTASPPTLSVQISGDTTTTIDGVRYIDSYVPVTGDTALIIKQGTDLVALGRIAAAFSATAWTTVTLGAGFTHNGNGGGAVRYRRVWDNGSPKMQWRGVAARSSGTAVISTPLAPDFRPAARVPMHAARTAVGGANSVKLDFESTGVVNMVGGTTAPAAVAAANTGGTTPNDSAHTHGGATGSTTPNTNSHTHGGSTGGFDFGAVGHSHGGAVATSTFDLSNHDHSVANTDHNHGSHDHGVPESSHNHGSHDHSVPGHAHAVDDPVWISFEGIEYFVD